MLGIQHLNPKTEQPSSRKPEGKAKQVREHKTCAPGSFAAYPPPLAQTWENPKAEHPEMKTFGDNDPVDIVEIGSVAIARGTIVQCKAVGTLAMIDEGELDWKVSPKPCCFCASPRLITTLNRCPQVIGISMSDPKAKDINSVADMEKAFPGQIDAVSALPPKKCTKGSQSLVPFAFCLEPRFRWCAGAARGFCAP